MSIWSTILRIFGTEQCSYMVVWREDTPAGTFMKGEPIAGKSDSDAISLVRAKFMHIGPDWTFWVLFRHDESVVTSQAGPKIEQWPHTKSRVHTDSHVQSTFRALR